MKKVKTDVMAKYLVAGDIITLDKKQVLVEAAQNRKDGSVFIAGKRVSKTAPAISEVIQLQPDQFLSTLTFVDELTNTWYHPSELVLNKQ
ncbi:hypothetical protein P4V43_12230 [Brevibacillus fortis]|uniref:hypothetical protein n=1 Tax=Brevibacillus fortis TaxID=2126352 RepID=UPI002E22E15C|nr:hypothetical protein [Brevibacillus fortis]